MGNESVSAATGRIYTRFVKLDKKDGTKEAPNDSQITPKSPDWGKFARYDSNGDAVIRYHEYMLGELKTQKLSEQGRLIPKLMEKFTARAREAGWSEPEIDRFLHILSQGAGDNLQGVLEEVEAYSRSGQPVLATAKSLKCFIIGDASKKELPLLEVILYLDKGKSYAQNMERALTTLASLAGLTGYTYAQNLVGTNYLERNFGQVALTPWPPVSVSGSENRLLLFSLLANSPETIKSDGLGVWAAALSGLDESTCYFLRNVAASGKITNLNDLEIWAWNIKTSNLYKDVDGDFAGFLMGKTIDQPVEVLEWAMFYRTLVYWQKSMIRDVVVQGVITDIADAKQIALAVNQSDFEAKLMELAYYSVPGNVEDLNPRERAAYEKLTAMQKAGRPAKEILDYMASLNSEVTKEEGYSGSPATVADTIDWTRIFDSTRGLYEKISAELEREAIALPANASADQVRPFLRRIPSRFLYETLRDKPALGEKFDGWLKANWSQARAMVGHIFLREDKCEYHYKLKAQLAEQGLAFGAKTAARAFVTSFEVVNLNTLEKDIVPLQVVVLGRDRLLLLYRAHGDYQAYVMNTQDQRGFRAYVRQEFGEKDPTQTYLVTYFPKIVFTSDTEYIISTDYSSFEGAPEILYGKSNAKPNQDNIVAADKQFSAAFRKEDEFLDRGASFFSAKLEADPQLAAQIRAERTVEVTDLFRLMMMMDSGGVKAVAPEVFGISNDDYDKYAAKLIQIIIQANASKEHLSREEFLFRAIKACNGKVMLASLIAYNALWGMRDNFLTVIPDAFGVRSDEKDPFGAIYHFYGTFFSAYALQKCLVNRYHNNDIFNAKIDAQVKDYQSKLKIDPEKQTIEGLPEEDQLMYVQYRLLQEGDGEAKEVLTLAGIYKEEVIEDGDASQEVFHDVEGMSFGHALFQAAYDVELTQGGAYFSTGDNYRQAFVALLKKKADVPHQFAFDEKRRIADIFKISVFDVLF